MESALILRKDQMRPSRDLDHETYQDFEYEIVTKGDGLPLMASFLEIPPGKSRCPYHYHTKSAELFYIISGTGIIRTPDGEISVTAGDVAVFPPGEKAAHKITNPSETETLTYLDVDTVHHPEVTFYPDSGKVGVSAGTLKACFREKDRADYFDGE